MNEFAQKVLDLPVLAQGVLGSFLFWLIYELAKIFVAGLIRTLAKFSRRVRKELIVARMLHHAHFLIDKPGKSSGAYFHVMSLYLGANRLVHGLIYICIGLVAQQFVGYFSCIPFAIAIGYLFLSMRLMHINFGPSESHELHQKEFEELNAEWDKLGGGY